MLNFTGKLAILLSKKNSINGKAPSTSRSTQEKRPCHSIPTKNPSYIFIISSNILVCSTLQGSLPYYCPKYTASRVIDNFLRYQMPRTCRGFITTKEIINDTYQAIFHWKASIRLIWRKRSLNPEVWKSQQRREDADHHPRWCLRAASESK